MEDPALSHLRDSAWMWPNSEPMSLPLVQRWSGPSACLPMAGKKVANQLAGDWVLQPLLHFWALKYTLLCFSERKSGGRPS